MAIGCFTPRHFANLLGVSPSGCVAPTHSTFHPFNRRLRPCKFRGRIVRIASSINFFSTHKLLIECDVAFASALKSTLIAIPKLYS